MVIEIFCYVFFECLEADAVASVHDLLQELVWVCGVQFEAFLDELLPQAVINIEKVMGILSSVFHHFCRERSHPPIC